MIFIIGFFPSRYCCKDCGIEDYKPLFNVRLSFYVFDIGFMVCLQEENN